MIAYSAPQVRRSIGKQMVRLYRIMYQLYPLGLGVGLELGLGLGALKIRTFEL